MPQKPAAKTKSPFTKDTFAFLAELGLNNEREWFEANKHRYEATVREPALALIRAMAPRLKKISKHLVASDKKVGGSLMRVHRDTRFAANKTPYKTNIGIQFRHEAGKDVHAPGLYLHIDPESVFLGAGMWHPEPPALLAIRKAIAAKPAAWKKARDDAGFTAHWSLRGDSLKRPPKGFAADHPCIEDLRRKDFIAVIDLSHAAVQKPGFVELVADRFAAAKPLMRYLAKTQDLPF